MLLNLASSAPRATLCTLAVFLFSPACSLAQHAEKSAASLPGARTAVNTLYRCIKKMDKTICDSVLEEGARQVFTESVLRTRHEQVATYEIIEVRELGEADPRLGIRRGDAQVFVREAYRDGTLASNTMSYLLRKEGAEWRIWNWVIVDEFEITPEDLRIPPMD